MRSGPLFAAIGLAAIAAGAGLWHTLRPAGSLPGATQLGAPAIAPAALLAMTFQDGEGRARSLAEHSAKIVVLNFWATWCAPCRAEMPAFDRLGARWAERGVQFVGLSAEAPEVASGFGRALGIRYPLWTGGDRATELSRRLGNGLGVLPHTVILAPGGQVVQQQVGPYSESDLEAELLKIASKTP